MEVKRCPLCGGLNLKELILEKMNEKKCPICNTIIEKLPCSECGYQGEKLTQDNKEV